jgi:hypothetical protein
VYINHRPAFGLNPADLQRAFNVLADRLGIPDGQPELSRESLLDLLQQHGEHISDYEMADCLSNLLHADEPAATDVLETMDADDACTISIVSFTDRRTFSFFQADSSAVNCPNK